MDLKSQQKMLITLPSHRLKELFLKQKIFLENKAISNPMSNLMLNSICAHPTQFNFSKYTLNLFNIKIYKNLCYSLAINYR